VTFGISAASGILVVFNRLDSFRETCDIIKQRDSRDDEGSLERKRHENEETDVWTTTAFKVQFWSFALGGLFFFLYAFGPRWDRLKALLDRLL